MKCIDEGFGRNPSLERFARLHCFQLFIFGLDLFTEIKEPLRAPGRRHIRLHSCGQQQYAHGFETRLCSACTLMPSHWQVRHVHVCQRRLSNRKK